MMIDLTSLQSKRSSIIFYTWVTLVVITLCTAISCWVAASNSLSTTAVAFDLVWYTFLIAGFAVGSYFFVKGRIVGNPFGYGVMIGSLLLLWNLSLMNGVQYGYFSSVSSYVAVTTFSAFYFVVSLIMFIELYYWRTEMIGSDAHDALASSSYPSGIESGFGQDQHGQSNTAAAYDSYSPPDDANI